MKKLFVLLLAFNILSAEAKVFKAPDVVVDTKLDFDWSSVLVARIRRFLRNTKLPDPFKQTFNEPLMVSENLVSEYLNPAAEELVTDLGQVIGINILDGKTQVTLHGLQYDIRGFKTELKSSEEMNDGFVIESLFSASRVKVSAKKVTLSLMLPGKNSLPLINIDIINPVITASHDKLINFFAKLKLVDNVDKFRILMEHADFNHMASSLVDNSDKINLSFDRIVVPEITIRAGNRNIDFNPKKIENLLISKQDGIKSLLIAQFSSLLKAGMGTTFLKAIERVVFKKEYWIDSNVLYSKIKFDKFSTDSSGNHVELEMPGDFCTKEKYLALKEKCLNAKTTHPVKSTINEEAHLDSLQYMKDLVEQGDANMVVSISEDYVNKLLAATYDAGLWDDMLKSAGVKMGPNKAFFRMDQKRGSNLGTLYLDMIYTPKKLERLAVGAKEVRFPLVIKAGMKIKKDKRTPIVIIHLDEIDTSEETLLRGIESQGMVSSASKLRFKKKILEAIRKETAVLANTDVLELRYPELGGLGLDKVDFVSDGNGRMNALMKLVETPENGAQ